MPYFLMHFNDSGSFEIKGITCILSDSIRLSITGIDMTKYFDWLTEFKRIFWYFCVKHFLVSLGND